MSWTAALISSVILVFLWKEYYETGCWILFGDDHGPYDFCGVGGLVLGLVVSGCVVYVNFSWLRNPKKK